MTKKYFLITLLIILLLLGLLVFFVFINKPSWGNMNINDFKIASFKDSWGTYPFPAEQINLKSINNTLLNLVNDTNKIELYQWKSNNNTYAFIYVIQLNNKPQNNLSKKSALFSQEYINNEEFYTYNLPIDYEGKKENMKLYLFDEDRFVFIVGGFWSFPEALVKKLIEKYPSKPTESKFAVSQEFIEKSMSNLFF